MCIKQAQDSISNKLSVGQKTVLLQGPIASACLAGFLGFYMQTNSQSNYVEMATTAGMRE